MILTIRFNLDLLKMFSKRWVVTRTDPSCSVSNPRFEEAILTKSGTVLPVSKISPFTLSFRRFQTANRDGANRICDLRSAIVLNPSSGNGSKSEFDRNPASIWASWYRESLPAKATPNVVWVSPWQTSYCGLTSAITLRNSATIEGILTGVNEGVIHLLLLEESEQRQTSQKFCLRSQNKSNQWEP